MRQNAPHVVDLIELAHACGVDVEVLHRALLCVCHVALQAPRLLVVPLDARDARVQRQLVPVRVFVFPRSASAPQSSRRLGLGRKSVQECQADKSAVATVAKTKELKKSPLWGRPRENCLVSFGKPSAMRAALCFQRETEGA